MIDPSHNSSSKYKVDREKYSENWKRIFGKKEEEPKEETKSEE